MISFLDSDYYQQFKKIFNEEEDARLCFKELEFSAASKSEVAEEIQDILNIISVAETSNWNFNTLFKTIKKEVPLKYLDIDGIIAIIHSWIEYKGIKLSINKCGNKCGNKFYDNIETDTVDSWDKYFFSVAKQTARNSKCFSRKIGAVLVRDKTIIGTGYNSPPRGVPSCDLRWGIDESLPTNINRYVKDKCPRKVLGYKSGEGIEICPASHAEESAIINSARMGICTKDASLFLTCGIPCGKCAVKIINAGISEVVVVNMDQYDKMSKFIFDHSVIKIRLYDFIK